MQALRSQIALLENVRCLECGEVYAKPTVGGTAEQNPGCPICGYVGWIPVSLPAERPLLRPA
jgi:predicted  nucleic acid-binding Zn-ribbon protein